MRHAWLFSSTLLLAGCPSDDAADGTDDGTDTSGGDSTGGGDDAMADSSGDGGPMGGPTPDGEACSDHDECMSLFCELWTDLSDNQMGVCVPAPGGGNTRMTATVFDFSTGAPVAGANVVVATALNASNDPTNAIAIMSGTSGADGRVDATSSMPISAALGIVALVSNDGGYLTATGLAAPIDDGMAYMPGVGNHDIWTITQAELDAWSAELQNDEFITDPTFPEPLLPLGPQGGVVGLVRTRTDGTPVAGVSVESTSSGSPAIVRYLADDGTFNADATGTAGIFVIVNPALGEAFVPTMDGVEIGGDGIGGSAPGAVFTLLLNVAP